MIGLNTIRNCTRAWAICALIPAMLMPVGCGTSVAVQGSLPAPLITPMPLRMGVHYSEPFKNFVHVEKVAEHGSYKIAFGDQNHSFFQRLFQSMFNEVVEVQLPPLSEELRNRLDGVIIPSIEKFGFLSPQVSGLKFYSVSIQYRLSIYDADGVQLATWSVIGYGKSPSEGLRQGAAVQQATNLAIRDAGAHIAMETKAQPQVAKWLATREARDR